MESYRYLELVEFLYEHARQLAGDYDGDYSYHEGRKLTAQDTKYWQAAEAIRSLLSRNEHLERSHSLIQDEIQQTLGKVLGYPWFKDDQKNFPGATEENGVCVGEHIAETIAMEAARKIKSLLALISEMAEAMEPWANQASSSDALFHKTRLFDAARQDENILKSRSVIQKTREALGEAKALPGIPEGLE